jgi:DNA helicase-2/ATP-dependent DNA helicase PcrA
MRDLQREFELPNVIRLEQNYRSHGNILDAANALIKQNRGRLGKNLWTEAGAGEPIRVFEAYSDVDEARFIVEEMSELVRDGVGRHQIALLYRSNAQSRVLEHQLFTQGVPYRVHGGLRFFDRQEIKHALAYLRLIANPDDDTAFARVVNFRRAGSAVAASKPCRKRRSRPIPASTTRPRASPARPGARSPDSSR